MKNKKRWIVKKIITKLVIAETSKQNLNFLLPRIEA